jgi:hypothetical protein
MAVNSPTIGAIRAGGMVQSNTPPYKMYLIAQIDIYGKVSERGSKEFEDFMRVVPRSVTIKRKVVEGVEISVP